MKKVTKLNTIVILVGLFCLQSCKVGPNYLQPKDTTTTTFRYTEIDTDSIINLKWWELFNDPVLDTLILTALKNNKNVLVAASRVEQSRANVGYVKADLGPKVGINGGATRGDYVNGIGLLNSTTTNFSGAAIANWELDFWGKYRRGTEAAQAELLASLYGKRAVEIALISEVAINYFQLIDFKARLNISESTLALRDSTLQIIQARFDKGYTHIIDVNQAEIQKATAQVAVPKFKRAIAFSEHNLSLLMGQSPDSIPTLKSLKEYKLPDSIPTGIPSEILQRRPDILESQEYYRAQNARIGVAQAMRFPSISLTGLLGLGSNDLSNLVSNGLGWSVGGSLTGPLFEWGKNKKRVEIERQRAIESLLIYENTVLNALLEVDNALVELSTFKEELSANSSMVLAAENASYLSRERYYQGVTSYLEVIENQRQEFDARLAYTENYQKLLTSYVSLYKSLGGGWVSQEEMDKYAQEVADQQTANNNAIDKNALYYRGQVVDYTLSKEEIKERKQRQKALNKADKERRKQERQGSNN